MIDFEKELNPAQLEAVTTLAGPLLVVAGAGSGKTRTLVFRLARLVESGVDPAGVLLLTFTRKAAEEMLERAGKLSDERCRRVAGGTFHSLAHLWLRRLAGRIGFPSHFHILDRADSESIVGALREEKNLPAGFPKKRTLAELFSRAINRQTPLLSVVESDLPHLLKHAQDILDLERAYQAYKVQAGLMDFDDLLTRLIGLLEEDPLARAEVSGRYSHLMVDEYQDTNPLQARLVKLLGQGHGNVMVVGDDSQSIYAFRGADFRNMLAFPEVFPGARIIKLERNYRSTQPILDVANIVIAQASQTFTKCLSAHRLGGIRPVLFEAADEADQTRFVVDQLQSLLAQGEDPSEMAVLFRSGFHSFDLEVGLNRVGLGFAKYGGFKFMESAHIKDALAFLKARINPADSLSLNRMLLLLPGVGPKKAQDIGLWLRETRTPLKHLDRFPGATKASAAGLRDLSTLMADLETLEIKGPAAELTRVLDFYTPWLAQHHDDYPRRIKELEHVADLAASYRSSYRFISDLALEPPTTLYSDEGNDRADRLTLSTIHSAKGLEWKTVFVIWAVEGRFPASQALTDPDALEEERRMMYVAVTRAKENLVIVTPQRSLTREGLIFHPPSRFVLEARENLAPFNPQKLKIEKETLARPAETSPKDLSPDGVFAVGELVSHPSFGLGRVAGYLGQKQIVVRFDRYGHKRLHLDFAPLSPARPE